MLMHLIAQSWLALSSRDLLNSAAISSLECSRSAELTLIEPIRSLAEEEVSEFEDIANLLPLTLRYRYKPDAAFPGLC